MMIHARFAVLLAAGGLIVGATASATFFTPNVTSANVDVVRQTTANVSLDTASATATTILSVILPAGSWVVSEDLSAVNYGATDYVRCGIYKGSTWLGGTAAMIGSAYPVENVNAMGAFKSASPATITVKCQHDTNPRTIYVDVGATLLAHKSTSLSH